MTLPASGTIKISELQTEFSAPAGTGLTSFYRGATYVPNTSTNVNVPTSGTIKLTDFYGASHVIPTSYVYFTSSTPASWTVPAGVTSIVIECIGAGANGATGTTVGGEGGGGGAYSKKTLTVTQGQVIYAGASAVGGTYSGVSPNSNLSSPYCSSASASFANGGLSTNSVGDVVYSGGNGGTTTGRGGGGGGGAAGPNGASTQPAAVSSTTGGNGTQGDATSGGLGGAGGALEANGTAGSNGTEFTASYGSGGGGGGAGAGTLSVLAGSAGAGGLYGGGGGGGGGAPAPAGNNTAGASGAQGMVRITY